MQNFGIRLRRMNDFIVFCTIVSSTGLLSIVCCSFIQPGIGAPNFAYYTKFWPYFKEKGIKIIHRRERKGRGGK